ncbi:basal cell adhesion molecule-like isoform X1 [Hylaeus anthracinus]|uniref:basal cell adhesion molecule-like isoform X1 n=1 Tax=Hylaeus anthracinus TaxID=313031 RepID=UPI0023B91307|nr:basal cell adhesion molecule-like isoform X1 [Hylaeus anthracinus]
MDLTLLLLALLLKQEVAGLKLIRINVPPYTLRGKSALLECRYDLETDKLYTITWYKDDEEFYRYVPRGEPTKHSYPVEGVKVDHRRSDHQQVLLQDVSLHSSGQYKCEVSGEAPNFNSVSAEASMEVVVLPQDGPTITGEEKIYATGDVLGLNCTSDKSHPAAKLKWFINGAEVMPDSRTVYDHHGLYSVISSLRLQLESDHIAGDKINVSGGSCERRDALRVPDSGERADAATTATRLENLPADQRIDLSTRRVSLALAFAIATGLAATSRTGWPRRS